MSWKDAYRIRANIVSSGIKSARQTQQEADNILSANKLAEAGFRKDIKRDLKQPDYKTPEQQTNEALDSTIEKGGIEGFMASAAKVAEQPGIKTALNVLSTGTYASANTANNLLDAVNNIADGNARGLTDFALAPITGIRQGLSAGLGQNPEDVTTYANVIDKSMDTINRGKEEGDEGWIDTESDAAKWGKGLGGFAGDVLLDPLTYATFGVTALAGGAVRGARQGSKAVKGIAEDAIAKAPELSEVVPPKSTKTMQEIADNPSGRIMTSLQEASKDHRSWKAARAKYKADKKDIKNARQTDETVDGEFVGISVKDETKVMQQRNAAKVAEQQAELEKQIELEIASAPAPKAEDIKQEVIQDKIPEPAPVVLPEATPVKAVEESLPVKFTEAIQDTVEAAPVAMPKPAAIGQNVEKFNQLESAWVRPKYGKASIMRELLNPGGDTIAKEIPASQLADPVTAAKYGIDPKEYADPSTHYLPREVMEAAAGKKNNSNTAFTGRTAASKDKKREQANTATGKKNARIKEETLDWTKAPKQRDDTPFVDLDDNPVVPKSSEIEDYVDLDRLADFAAENPGYKLLGEPGAKGKVGITLDKFVELVGNDSKLMDSVIEHNLFFLGKFADEGQGIDDDALGLFQSAYDSRMADFMGGGSKLPEETPDVDAAKAIDEAEELEDLSPLQARMVTVMEANPKAWTPEYAKSLGIDPDDGILSPAEIAALTLPMTSTQIRAKIKRGDMSKADMEIIRAVTGLGPKATGEELATKFVQLRMAHKKELKAAEKPAKIARQTKAEEVARTTSGDEALRPIKPNEEHIESIKADTAELAEEFVKSPVAFDEPYQVELRRLSYVNALTDTTHGLSDETLLAVTNAATGRSGKMAINDYGHQAVKDALAVQLKEADFRTQTGMRTLTEDKTTGGAWSPTIWGSNSQQALHDSVIRAMLAQKGTAINKFNFTEQRKFYMAVLKVADTELRAAGVEPFLNQVDNIAGNARTNVSLYDMFAALDEAGLATKTIDKHVFGYPSDAFGITQMQGAFETMIRMRKAGKSEEAIRTRIRSQLTVSQAKHGRPINNDNAVVYGKDPNKPGKLVTGSTASRLSMKVEHNKSLADLPADDAVRTAKRLDAVAANNIADALLDPAVFRNLSYRQMINSAAHNSSLADHVTKHADAMVERLYDVAKMTGPGDALRAFTADSRALRATIPASDYDKAKDALDLKMAEFLSEAERLGVNTAAKRSTISREPMPVPKATERPSNAGKEPVLYVPKGSGLSGTVDTPKGKVHYVVDRNGVIEARNYKTQQAANKAHVEDAKAAEKDIAETPKPDDVEPFEMRAAEIANAAFRKMHPVQRLINPRLGMTPDAYRAVNSGLHSIARQQAHFHQSLSMHLEKYSGAVLKGDFEYLQRAARNHDEKNPFTLAEDATESQRELYGIMSTMLEVSNGNVFARNAVGVKHFNALAGFAGLDKSWRFKEGATIYDNIHLWATEWEGIGDKGVLDFLSKMHSVAIKSSQEIAIGASFSKEFGKTVREPGYVKLSWANRTANQSKSSSFYDLIDHELYYPKDVASQVIQIDKIMRETRSLDTSKPIGKFMVNVFDPITNALKASQTTVRPGHWTVSIAGDLLRNQIAGVNSIKPYQHAVEIMRSSGLDPDQFIGKIESAEALAKYRKSQEVAQGFTASSAGKGVVFFVGGSKKNVSYETMEKILHDVVMLPKHRGGGGVIEDRFVGENVTNKFSRKLEKATDFVTDNDKFSLNALAAKRDNFMRIALAVDYASKRKWDSLTDMKKGMEDYITKWAPISTDMTSFESKYARRSMLYYTWLRGITPRMIDSAVTKPGVATIVPKALYNAAYANGVNPESIGDPFPEDKMFPDYYRNNVLGPQWMDDYGMWGINPSSPVIEVANTFARFKPGDPGGNVTGALGQALGMSTPFAKLPIELGMGAQSNGVPIEDGMQYLGDNLGGSYLSSLSRATGKTINETGIVNRTDGAHKDSIEDQVEHAKLQGINFLTGAKLTDYQSIGSLKSAEYSMMQKLKEEADLQLRKQ